jgi:hypothetical protein
MTHAELLARIRAACWERGLLVYHSVDTRRDWSPGFPDLVIAGTGGHLFAEVKVADDLSFDQGRWAWRLRAGGAPYVVWRPGDWKDHQIWKALHKLTGAGST